MTTTIARRSALALGAAALAAPRLARAQRPHRVRLTFDWVLHGAYAFGVAAERDGIFERHGLDMPISRGFGAGRVPVDIAAGTYDLGFGDVTPQLRFMAENPDRDLVCVAVLYDRSPLSCTVRADGPIREPRDLEGRTLAAPEFDGGRQIFPVFARAAGFDAAKVNWLTVSPELREPMMIQRRADGVTGFVTSTALSLKGLGLDLPQQRIMYYRDHGLDFYGSSLITSRAFARERPEALRAAVAALIEGMVRAHAEPDEAIRHLRARESLTDVALETERQAMVFREMLLSDSVRANGLSHVEPDRLRRQIDAVAETFNLARRPTPEQAFTDAFLPPPEARRLRA